MSKNLCYNSSLPKSPFFFNSTDCFKESSIKISIYSLVKQVKIEIFFLPTVTDRSNIYFNNGVDDTDGFLEKSEVVNINIAQYSFITDINKYYFKTFPIKGEKFSIKATLMDDSSTEHTFIPETSTSLNSSNHTLYMNICLSKSEAYLESEVS